MTGLTHLKTNDIICPHQLQLIIDSNKNLQFLDYEGSYTIKNVEEFKCVDFDGLDHLNYLKLDLDVYDSNNSVDGNYHQELDLTKIDFNFGTLPVTLDYFKLSLRECEKFYSFDILKSKVTDIIKIRPDYNKD